MTHLSLPEGHTGPGTAERGWPPPSPPASHWGLGLRPHSSRASPQDGRFGQGHGYSPTELQLSSGGHGGSQGAQTEETVSRGWRKWTHVSRKICETVAYHPVEMENVLNELVLGKEISRKTVKTPAMC